jgi:hypothetical protein
MRQSRAISSTERHPLQKQNLFCHRHNKDGTVDSICMKCFLTAGNAICEETLARLESEHICNPLDIERFFEGSRA